jgi:hypothetical protein
MFVPVDCDCYWTATRDCYWTATRDCYCTATRASAATKSPQPRPHRDSRPHQHSRQQRNHRDSTAPRSSPTSARVLRTAHPRLPRARSSRAPVAKIRIARHSPFYVFSNVFIPLTNRRPVTRSGRFWNPSLDAIWWRPTPSRTRAKRVVCSQVGRQQSGRVGDDCDDRVPDPRCGIGRRPVAT